MSDRNDILIKNIQCLERDGDFLKEERHLLIRTFLDDVLQPSLSFEDNTKRILSAYRVIEQETARDSWFSFPETKAQVVKLFLESTMPSTLLEGIPTIDQDEKVACWSTNRYSQLAYEKLSQQCPRLKQMIVESFTDVCEAINNGECSFGILPIENSADKISLETG